MGLEIIWGAYFASDPLPNAIGSHNWVSEKRWEPDRVSSQFSSHGIIIKGDTLFETHLLICNKLRTVAWNKIILKIWYPIGVLRNSRVGVLISEK
jgi:hypothetical protein